MKIMVTGGAGFIGSHIVDAYIERGHDVIVVDNLSTGCRENVNPKATLHVTDICDPKIAKVFADERPELLSHHAAQIDVRFSVREPIQDLKINVGGLLNLMESGRNNGLKKVIFASSGGTVYGDQIEYPADEKHPTNPMCPYGASKIASEKYLNCYKSCYGIDWIALRYGNVYGPRQKPHGEAGVIAIFASKMLEGKLPVINGSGNQTRDYVYISDVVSANMLASEKAMSGPYNVGRGEETDVNELFSRLREITGSSCPEEHGAPMPGEQQRVCLSSKRITDFGWVPKIALPEGLLITVDWLKGEIN